MVSYQVHNSHSQGELLSILQSSLVALSSGGLPAYHPLQEKQKIKEGQRGKNEKNRINVKGEKT